MVAKNLRLEGLRLFDPVDVVGSLQGLNRSASVSFREAPNPFHLPGFLESRRPGPFNSNPLSGSRPGHSLQDLIFECHAFGVIFLEPCFRGVDVCEHLEMLRVTDLLARVDVDEDCHFWSLLR
jgi:hypothetical protein